VLAAVWLLLLTAASAYGAEVTVECGKKKTTNFTSINTALATLSKQGPNTIHVSGPCKEAVLVDGYEDLTIIGSGPSASISDPTPSVSDDNDVVDIMQSRNVTVQGLTINGGILGVACFQFSVCYVREMLVQGQSDTGVGYFRSSGFVDNTTIQNTQFGGLAAFHNSNVIYGSNLFGTPGTATIQNNGTVDNGSVGVNVQNGSHVTLLRATIQNHSGGDGVAVSFGSNLRLLVSSTITGNAGNGIVVSGAVARIQNGGETVSITNNGGSGIALANTATLQAQGPGNLNITGNTGNGISVGHLSFLRLGGGRTITGNGSPDVNCSSVTSVTIGTGGSATPNLGGGTTNCTEPAP
jgi:hypothetical protein